MNPPAGVTPEQWDQIMADPVTQQAPFTREQETVLALNVRPLASADEAA